MDNETANGRDSVGSAIGAGNRVVINGEFEVVLLGTQGFVELRPVGREGRIMYVESRLVTRVHRPATPG